MTVPKPTRIRIENLPCVFPHAAGLDIGSAEIVAALPPECDVTVVRTFTTFTADLHQLVTLDSAREFQDPRRMSPQATGQSTFGLSADSPPRSE